MARPARPYHRRSGLPSRLLICPKVATNRNLEIPLSIYCPHAIPPGAARRESSLSTTARSGQGRADFRRRCAGAPQSRREAAASPPSARGNSARAISPVRSTCNTQRPSQRPPCRRERSKNAWRSSSVYCRRRAFLVLLWTVPPVISPCLTAGHRSEMWLGNRSARTRAPQFLHTERESSALSAAFSTMRRFRSLSRAFSRCSRAISVTISCVVTFAYSGTLLGPDQAGGILQEAENPLTPEDAFWLGLVDEVMGANLPTLRRMLERFPLPKQ
jgi:hypothetical protein